MKNSLRLGKKAAALLMALFLVLSVGATDSFSQDNGPTNYCIPGPELVTGNNAIFGTYANVAWCYPLYLKQVSTYYDYYFTTPIKEVKITETNSGEVKLLRQSYGNGGLGMGPWEGCYKYTGVRGEMSPGEKFNIRYVVENNYYGYNGTNYCIYNYGTYYSTRVWIDFNLNGIFEHLTEWINTPAKIQSGQTLKIGATTTDWWYYSVANCTDRVQEFQITVPDEQPNGVGRMRVMHAYYYPSSYSPTVTQLLGMGGNACWNGYAYDYTAYYGGWYGYNYGEIEDYLIEFALPFKGSFPDTKAPDDILLANEKYDGTTRMQGGTPTLFKRPFVLFGNPMPAGSILQYKIVGPLPDVDNVIYEGVDNVTKSRNIRVGQDIIGTNTLFNIQDATGPGAVQGPNAGDGKFGFRWASGGEYQLVLGLGKDVNSLKFQKKNFTVSWEWDIAAQEIVEPLSSGEPRFHKYPRGLEMGCKGVVQNVGLRGIAKFDAFFHIYNSKGQLQKTFPITWDTANFGQYVVQAKQKVNLDFGIFKTFTPDDYTVKLEVDLRSATDMEPYNNFFRRADQPAYVFSVKDEIEAAARSIDIPASGSTLIAGRPFMPMGTLSNEGVGDISNAPTRLIIRKYPSGQVVYNQLVNVQDIPQGRYNLKQIVFPLTQIIDPGQYEAVLEVTHPDDLITDNNKVTVLFTVKSGLIGKYTIGNKNAGQTNNFKTIAEAMDALYLNGMNGSVTFEFTDAEYTVTSRNDGAPAWDLSTAIMGLGYNAQKGEYWTLTFKPSEDRLVTRASVKINLQSKSGHGVYFGQALVNSNPYSVQQENASNNYYVPYSNNGGYITFDGGANKSFRFVLNTDQQAFGSVFYLAPGSSNITVKNVIMENNKLSIANKVRLPNANYSVVDGFVFTPNTEVTETGWVGYSAGIVNRAELFSLRTEAIVVALDTLPNKNNKFIGNDISGFGYGIVSLGIGALRVPKISDFAPFYNENTVIEGNKIYNVTGAGIVVGNESKGAVKNNVVFDVKGDAGSFAAGIMVGGNATQSLMGYNNYEMNIDGNAISNVRGRDAVYGILVEQDVNKYQVGTEFRVFPPVEDKINIMNNAMWNLRAQNSNTMRVGVHMLTQRKLNIADQLTRLVTPNYSDYFIRNSAIANNTVLLTEDGVTNNNNLAGLGIQQVKNLKVYNNAVAVNDPTISSNNQVASVVFYHGDYPELVGLDADRNAYWVGSANISAYRHVYTDWKTRIWEIGTRNEYRSLSQWQMQSRTELNTVSTGNFVNDHYFVGTYPEEIKVRTNIKGSVLTRRGDRLSQVTHDLYGNIRGVAGGRYDIGAVESNGALFNHDAEMLVITAPGTYRATDGIFNDAEYLMTKAPIEVKAIVRNSGNMPVFNKKLTLNIYRELPNGTFGLEFGPVEKLIDLDATENTEITFNVGDGIGNDFVPKSYNDLRGSGYTIPAQFTGMEPNVTPRYRIVISADADEFNSNNATEKLTRFYLMRSDIKFLVTNKANFAEGEVVTTDGLAYGLNFAQIKNGMKQLDWEVDLIAGRYDYDVFNRLGWEPRNVDYTIYRSILWADGHNNTLTRLEKLNLTNFIKAGNVIEKKNLMIGSEEMVRNNVNIDDADEVFVRDILRADYRHPGNPLGVNANYDGHSVTGIAIGRDLVFDIKSTGVTGDSYPMPGLMNIVHTGNGISRMTTRYNSVQNPEWPDAARIAGVATTTLTSNTVFHAIDWRHFSDIETVLRGTFDFIEYHGGTVVPVELLSFDAKPVGKRVDVSWATASELNTSRFEVEKSLANSGIFTKVGEMEAAGNSSVVRNYGPVVDNAVEYGNTYVYRLKTYDRDGSFSYSEERTVTLTGINGVVELNQPSPNPVNSTSSISYSLSQSANVTIYVIDATGKEVAKLFDRMQTAGTHNLNVNASNFASGAYQVVLRSGDILRTVNMNVVR